MGTIITLQSTEKIIFHVLNNSVLISIITKTSNYAEEQQYIISKSEMNKLLGKIQRLNFEIDVYEQIELSEIKEEEYRYTLSMEKFNFIDVEELLIEELFYLRKISA